MKKIFTSSLLTLILGVSHLVMAQSNFQQGFIITLKNDTIYGLVDSRVDQKQALLCSFKKDRKAPVEKYKPGEIYGYRFLNGKYYVSKQVKINGEDKMLFLEYVVNGIADLYFAKYKNRNSFYIQKEDDLHPIASTTKKNHSVLGRLHP